VRPNIKGHKFPALLDHQLAHGSKGVEIAKVTEMLQWMEQGYRTEFVVAWCWDRPATWAAVAGAAARGFDVVVDVDSAGMVSGYDAAAARAGTRLGVRVQVDSGLRGVPPEEAVGLARRVVESEHLDLVALTSYRSIYRRDLTRDPRPPDVLGQIEAEALVGLAEQLEDAVDHLDVVCGSTPTAWGAAAVDGVTEIAAAAYTLGDWGLAQRGTISTADIAMGFLTSVVERRGDLLVVDLDGEAFHDRRWYPGLFEQTRGATPDGGLLVGEVGPRGSFMQHHHGPVPAVGDRVIVLPGNVNGISNGPGGAVVVFDDDREPVTWERVHTSVTEDDPVV
jgi:D-serine deaminase-like pyridoxal phosphate-dependent protein